MLKEITLATLGDLENGAVGHAVALKLAQAVRDCDDRPFVKKPRIINLRIALVPEVEQLNGDGTAATVAVGLGVEISSVLPKQASRPINCNVKAGNRLLYNDLSEANAGQNPQGKTQERTFDSSGCNEGARGSTPRQSPAAMKYRTGRSTRCVDSPLGPAGRMSTKDAP